jgi:hypothetical protein
VPHLVTQLSKIAFDNIQFVDRKALVAKTKTWSKLEREVDGCIRQR